MYTTAADLHVHTMAAHPCLHLCSLPLGYLHHHPHVQHAVSLVQLDGDVMPGADAVVVAAILLVGHAELSPAEGKQQWPDSHCNISLLLGK